MLRRVASRRVASRRVASRRVASHHPMRCLHLERTHHANNIVTCGIARALASYACGTEQEGRASRASDGDRRRGADVGDGRGGSGQDCPPA